MKKLITLADVRENEQFSALIKAANECLSVLGYTEHGLRHGAYVARTSGNILRRLGFDARTVELAEIAGWIHDIGNAINRHQHGLTGSVLAFQVLTQMGMDPSEIATIISAIGSHEEQTGVPVNPVSAALILADKSDTHRTRVRKGRYNPDDIHDRVNFSIKKNFIVVDAKHHVIKLVIYMDEPSSPMEYFRIYMSRMVLSEKAAEYLGCSFQLVINDVHVNNHCVPEERLVLGANEENVSEEN